MPWRVQKGRRRNGVWGKQDTNYGSSAPSFSGRQTWDHHVRLTSQALSSPTVPVDAVVDWFLGRQALAVEQGIISAIDCLRTDGTYFCTDALWHCIANVPDQLGTLALLLPPTLWSLEPEHWLSSPQSGLFPTRHGGRRSLSPQQYIALAVLDPTLLISQRARRRGIPHRPPRPPHGRQPFCWQGRSFESRRTRMSASLAAVIFCMSS